MYIFKIYEFTFYFHRCKLCYQLLIFYYNHVNVGHVKEMEFLFLFIEQFSFFMGLMDVFKKHSLMFCKMETTQVRMYNDLSIYRFQPSFLFQLHHTKNAKSIKRTTFTKFNNILNLIVNYLSLGLVFSLR
jgi:hypothetical protein